MDKGFLGAGKIVAVINTGYRPRVDLNANIINGYDFITSTAMSNDGNGRDSSALIRAIGRRRVSAIPVPRPPTPAGMAPTSPARWRR